MIPFYGREQELTLLRQLLEKPSPSLVVITGRRRIGKSRLIEEFAKPLRKLSFTGMPPGKGVLAARERKRFAKQLERDIGLRGIKSDDWEDLLWNLGQYAKEGQFLIVFDEINWIGTRDPAFLGILKTVWDTVFSKNPNLILILSGSMSGWIEKNILKSTGFFGRIFLEIHLDELPLPACNHFWGAYKDEIAPAEKFKILSITGGVPLYLEAIDPKRTAEENIRRLCFTQGGLLFQEYDRICTELFLKRGPTYEKILKQLAKSTSTFAQLERASGLGKTGVLSEYLDDLEKIGYISIDKTWHLKDGKPSPLRHYRMQDNYLRFYLRYIASLREAIERGKDVEPENWSTILGLQFENLVLHNRKSLYKLLNIPVQEIAADNPFFQRKTALQPGCQIDYLIQTKYNMLYICEIRFQKDPIKKSIINEVQKKGRTLKTPKGFSKRYVLIHVNGVEDSVKEERFFSNIIDFGELLK